MFPALWAHPDSLAFFYEVASGRKSILGTDHPCNEQSIRYAKDCKWPCEGHGRTSVTAIPA